MKIFLVIDLSMLRDEALWKCLGMVVSSAWKKQEKQENQSLSFFTTFLILSAETSFQIKLLIRYRHLFGFSSQREGFKKY